MRRFHLFEFEDQTWFPRPLRDGVTDFLQFAVSSADLYKPIAAKLNAAIVKTKAARVIDLCAGGGGPWQELQVHVNAVRDGQVHVVLTDAFPNVAKMAQFAATSAGRLSAVSEPVSALDVAPTLLGFRTLFSAFHHFDRPTAKAIIADAVSKRCGIAVAESTQRHALMLAYMLLTPFLVLVATPKIRPFRWSRLIWTYLLPLIPLTVMFDGLVSCLRTYSPRELQDLVREVPDHESYDWEIGVERMRGLPVGVTYLFGTPQNW